MLCSADEVRAGQCSGQKWERRVADEASRTSNSYKREAGAKMDL